MSATRFAVAHFCDVSPPLVNGVVRAVSDLMQGQRLNGTRVFTIAPAPRTHIPGWNADRTFFALPSWPLASSAGYRAAISGPGDAELARACADCLPVAHAHSIFRAAAFARHYARRSDVPSFLTYHTRLQYYAHYAGLAAAAFRAFYTHLIERAASRTDGVFVPNTVVADELRAAGVRVPLFIIPHGIDTEHYRGSAAAISAARLRVRQRFALAPQTRIVLSAARLAREKNIGALINAAAALLENTVLLICGSGPEAHNLRDRATAVAPGRIIFAGSIAPNDMPEMYFAADAFVFPSVSESQGLVLWEAFAAGLPIVAADCAVTQEMIAGAGVRYMRADCIDFAAALAVASADAPRTELLAQRAQKLRDMDRRATARRTLDVYAEVYASEKFAHASPGMKIER